MLLQHPHQSDGNERRQRDTHAITQTDQPYCELTYMCRLIGVSDVSVVEDIDVAEAAHEAFKEDECGDCIKPDELVYSFENENAEQRALHPARPGELGSGEGTEAE